MEFGGFGVILYAGNQVHTGSLALGPLMVVLQYNSSELLHKIKLPFLPATANFQLSQET